MDALWRALSWGAIVAAPAICLVHAIGDYRVASSPVPGMNELRSLAGEIESCKLEPQGLVTPDQKLRGAWRGTSSYILTLRNVDARVRTSVFKCGLFDGAHVDVPATALVGVWPGHSVIYDGHPLYNAYGLAVNGNELHRALDDITDHSRFVRYVAPINIVGLLLIAILAPVNLIKAFRRRAVTTLNSQAAPQDEHHESMG